MTVALVDRRPVAAPSTESLLEIARTTAASVARPGTTPTVPPGERRHVRVRCTADHDVCVIVWGAGSGVDLHDHGPSAGAFAVVRGALTETDASEDAPEPRRVAAGDDRALAPGILHAVRNEGRTVAVSVHVYAPPLTTMGFYDDDRRELRREEVR